MTVSRPQRASTAKSYRHILATTGPRIVVALSAGALLAGCSAGQITQTANQLPAVNGVEINDSGIALRNVHIVLSEGGPATPADEEATTSAETTTAEAEPAEGEATGTAPTTTAAAGGAGQLLVFTAINQATDVTDRLVSIETDAADQVVITPSSGDALELRPQRSLTSQGSSGTGATTAATSGASGEGASGEASTPVSVTLVGTTDAVRPGLKVPVTFVFERAGSVEVDVPVDGGPLLERNPDAVLEDHGPLSGPNAGGGH